MHSADCRRSLVFCSGYLRFGVIAALCVIACTETSSGQINDATIAPVGLEVHWQGSLGGAGLSRAEQNMAIWAHTTERREYVDVYLGARLLERIDARQVDRAAVERRVLEGSPASPIPLLGMKGALERAGQLSKTYAVLGRQLTVKSFNEPVIYVVTVASNGIVSAFDGESGEVLWQSSVPRSELMILGPGVSDDYVTVVNGNHFFVMRMKDGTLVTTRRLEYTPSSSPIPVHGKIMVPSEGGRLIAYDIVNPLIPPIVLRAGRENLEGVTLSADRDFVAWSSQKSMFLAQGLRTPTIWAKVNSNDDVRSRPVATPKGFVFASNNGTVIHSTTQRTGTYLWRANVSLQTAIPPVVGNDRVFLVSDDKQAQCLDLQYGTVQWPTTTKNVDRILGVGKEHIYARSTSGMLMSIRISDGQIDGRTSVVVPGVVPNSINDRFFVVTRNGHLTCLREKGAIMPTMWIKDDVGADKKSKEPVRKTPSEEAAPAPVRDDDPFGADTSSSPSSNNATDPFDPF